VEGPESVFKQVKAPETMWFSLAYGLPACEPYAVDVQSPFLLISAGPILPLSLSCEGLTGFDPVWGRCMVQLRIRRRSQGQTGHKPEAAADTRKQKRRGRRLVRLFPAVLMLKYVHEIASAAAGAAELSLVDLIYNMSYMKWIHTVVYWAIFSLSDAKMSQSIDQKDREARAEHEDTGGCDSSRIRDGRS